MKGYLYNFNSFTTSIALEVRYSNLSYYESPSKKAQNDATARHQRYYIRILHVKLFCL